jgi:FkbM family methyltransferase
VTPSGDRSGKPRTPDEQLMHALAWRGVDLVLDVGANRGQYAQRLRTHGYLGRIVSFEPLPDAHRELCAAAAADAGWEVGPAVALGARSGRALLERSAESDMSSLHAQTALLRAVSPSSAVLERVAVEVAALDDVVTPYLRPDYRTFLKIDVQGAEADVLAGAGALLPHLVGLQVELPLVPCYEGERPWREMLAALEAEGFELALLLPGYYERKLGRQLQVDLVLFRPEPAAQ